MRVYVWVQVGVCVWMRACICVYLHSYYLGYLSMIRSANKNVCVTIWIDPIVGIFSHRFIFCNDFEAA